MRAPRLPYASLLDEYDALCAALPPAVRRVAGDEHARFMVWFAARLLAEMRAAPGEARDAA